MARDSVSPRCIGPAAMHRNVSHFTLADFRAVPDAVQTVLSLLLMLEMSLNYFQSVEIAPLLPVLWGTIAASYRAGHILTLRLIHFFPTHQGKVRGGH